VKGLILKAAAIMGVSKIILEIYLLPEVLRSQDATVQSETQLRRVARKVLQDMRRAEPTVL
jgi:hypothetical protein